MTAMVELRDVAKSFGDVRALRGVSLSLERGGQYAVQGASGSGKSTLLHLMGGLDTPTRGSVLFDGRDVGGLDDEGLARHRGRNVGFVFQFHFLLPSMTALENVLLPCEIAGLPRAPVLERARALAGRLGVAHCLDKGPGRLSGGERQRVGVLRALSLSPPLLLCDEPTGHLDSDNSERVAALLRELARETGATLVVVTHDEAVASTLPNRLRMRDGRLA